MDFRLLGPLDVQSGGRPLRLGGRRLRALLAVPLLHHGRTVPIDTITAAVWPGEPPNSALANIRTYVHELRRQPRRLEDGAQRLTSQPGGYRLLVRPVRTGCTELPGPRRRGRTGGPQRRPRRTRGGGQGRRGMRPAAAGPAHHRCPADGGGDGIVVGDGAPPGGPQQAAGRTGRRRPVRPRPAHGELPRTRPAAQSAFRRLTSSDTSRVSSGTLRTELGIPETAADRVLEELIHHHFLVPEDTPGPGRGHRIPELLRTYGRALRRRETAVVPVRGTDTVLLV